MHMTSSNLPLTETEMLLDVFLKVPESTLVSS